MNTANHERNADVITHEATGTSRVSFSPKPANGGDDHVQQVLAASARVQLRDHSNGASYVSVTTGTDANAVDRSGRITHAATQAGFSRSGADITENDLVMIDGVQLQLRGAIAAGIITRNADGSFSLVGKR